MAGEIPPPLNGKLSITRILIAAIMRGTTVSQPRRLDMVGGMVPGTTGRNNTTITRGLGSTDVVSECSDPLVDQPSMDIMWCLKGSEGLNFYWIKWWPYDSLSSLYLKSILLSFHFHRQMIKIWVSSLSFSISLCPSYPGSIKRSKVFTSELLQRHHLQDDQAPVTEPHCNEGKTLCRRRECSLKKLHNCASSVRVALHNGPAVNLDAPVVKIFQVVTTRG